MPLPFPWQRLTLPADKGAKPVVLEDGKKISDFDLKARAPGRALAAQGGGPSPPSFTAPPFLACAEGGKENHSEPLALSPHQDGSVVIFKDLGPQIGYSTARPPSPPPLAPHIDRTVPAGARSPL